MPFENESIDIFFLHNVFHHIPDIEKFFNEVRTDLFDINIDGLNTLRYKVLVDKNLNGYRKVSVQ